MTSISTPAHRHRVPRMPRAKDLKFLAQYQELGYSFERNGHLKVYDPAGLLVTTIACTPSDRNAHKAAQRDLRRHERTRKDQ